MPDIKKLVKKYIPNDTYQNIEPFGHLLESVAHTTLNGFPAYGMHIIGVTGTNGKTTTTFLIHKMLVNAGYKVGMLSTVAYGMNDDIQQQFEHITTLEAKKLQKKLKEFKDAGVEWVIIESSSHALAQNRIWGIPYEIAVMTNVTGDHLDYHGTFENYLEAKRKLFRIANKHGLRYGVINGDDTHANLFVDLIDHSTTYGLKHGKLKANNIKLSADHSSYTARVGKDEYKIRVNIPGEFNVSNSLAAVAVGRKIGLTKKEIEEGIAALKGVEGRMTVVHEGQKFNVIIDYASTPDAFEKLFESVRPTTKGKLVALFGSAGRRDEQKRWTQGEIAGKYADELILTEEDDRDIDGNLILSQIAEGAAKSGKTKDKDMFLILDRKKAIEFALTRLKSSDDTLVLLGKGHEKTIERASGDIEWDEIEVTKIAIKKLLKK
jgi:UDP-N-acetylmuramoyl-L-alanyl-D-glutamate--2,6-diaminopimelate ligase